MKIFFEEIENRAVKPIELVAKKEGKTIFRRLPHKTCHTLPINMFFGHFITEDAAMALNPSEYDISLVENAKKEGTVKVSCFNMKDNILLPKKRR